MVSVTTQGINTTVFGTLTDAKGTPLYGVLVQLYYRDGRYNVQDAYSDINGNWSVTAPTANWVVGLYEAHYFGGGLEQQLAPDGTWEVFEVTGLVTGTAIGVTYRGLWQPNTFYHGNGNLRDIVRVQPPNVAVASYYSSRSDHTSAATWALDAPSWSAFSATFASVATDLLFAQDVSVGRTITLGTDALNTGNFGIFRTATATGVLSGSGIWMAGDATGTGFFRVGTTNGVSLVNGIYWNGPASQFSIMASNFQLTPSGYMWAANAGGFGGTPTAPGVQLSSTGMVIFDLPPRAVVPRVYIDNPTSGMDADGFRDVAAATNLVTNGKFPTSLSGWNVDFGSIVWNSGPGPDLQPGFAQFFGSSIFVGTDQLSQVISNVPRDSTLSLSVQSKIVTSGGAPTVSQPQIELFYRTAGDPFATWYFWGYAWLPGTDNHTAQWDTTAFTVFSLSGLVLGTIQGGTDFGGQLDAKIVIQYTSQLHIGVSAECDVDNVTFGSYSYFAELNPAGIFIFNSPSSFVKIGRGHFDIVGQNINVTSATINNLLVTGTFTLQGTFIQTGTTILTAPIQVMNYLGSLTSPVTYAGIELYNSSGNSVGFIYDPVANWWFETLRASGLVGTQAGFPAAYDRRFAMQTGSGILPFDNLIYADATGALTAGGATTSFLPEGTNLYFTNERVATVVSGLSMIRGTVGDTQVAFGTADPNLITSSAHMYFDAGIPALVLDAGTWLGVGVVPLYPLHVFTSALPAGIPIDVAAIEVSPTGSLTAGFGPALLFKDLGYTAHDMARIAGIYDLVGSNNLSALSFWVDQGNGLQEQMRLSHAGNLAISGGLTLGPGPSFTYNPVTQRILFAPPLIDLGTLQPEIFTEQRVITYSGFLSSAIPWIMSVVEYGATIVPYLFYIDEVQHGIGGSPTPMMLLEGLTGSHPGALHIHGNGYFGGDLTLNGQYFTLGAGSYINPGTNRSNAAFYVSDRAGETTTPHSLFYVHRTGPIPYDTPDDLGAAIFSIDTNASSAIQPHNAHGLRSYVNVGHTNDSSYNGIYTPTGVADGVEGNVYMYASGLLPLARAIAGQVLILGGDVNTIIASGIDVGSDHMTVTNGQILHAYSFYASDQTVGTLENAAIRLEATGMMDWNNDTWLYRSGVHLLSLSGILNIVDANNRISTFDNLSPLTTIGDLITWSGGHNIRLPGSTAPSSLSSPLFLAGFSGQIPFWSTPPVSALQTFWFTNSGANVAGHSTWLQMPQLNSPPGNPLATISAGTFNVGNHQEVATWICASGLPNSRFIPDGVWHVHIHARKTGAGQRDTDLHFHGFKYTASGTQVYLFQSSDTAGLTNAFAEYDLTAVTPSYNLLPGERIGIDIMADVSGTGNNVTVELQVDGQEAPGDITNARVELPATVVDSSTFIPYTGAVGDMDFANHSMASILNLSLTGTLTIATLSGILHATLGVVSGAAVLENLSNVLITSITDGQSLAWNSSLSKWVNTTISGGGGGGSIGGSIANTQVAVGNGTNTIAGSSAFTFDGTNLQLTGAFGIGVTPLYPFHVYKSSSAAGAAPIDVAAIEVHPTDALTAGFGPALLFKDLGYTAHNMARIAAIYDLVGVSNLSAITFSTDGGVGLVERARIDHSGDIYSFKGASNGGIHIDGTQYLGYGFNRSSNEVASWFIDPTNNVHFVVQEPAASLNGGAGYIEICVSGSFNPANALTLNAWTGMVGIGVSPATARLDVSETGGASLVQQLSFGTTPVMQVGVQGPIVYSYGSTPLLFFRQAGGTVGSPTYPGLGSFLGIINAAGWDESAVTWQRNARLNFKPVETWTSTAQGTYADLQLTFATTKTLGTAWLISPTVSGMDFVLPNGGTITTSKVPYFTAPNAAGVVGSFHGLDSDITAGGFYIGLHAQYRLVDGIAAYDGGRAAFYSRMQLVDQSFTGDLLGAYISVDFHGNGTNTGRSRGYHSEVAFYSATSGFSLANHMHYYAGGAVGIGGGVTISNVFGMYIEAQKVSGVTNGYGIYQAGVDDLNVFAGSVVLSGNMLMGDSTGGFDPFSAGGQPYITMVPILSNTQAEMSFVGRDKGTGTGSNGLINFGHYTSGTFYRNSIIGSQLDNAADAGRLVMYTRPTGGAVTLCFILNSAGALTLGSTSGTGVGALYAGAGTFTGALSASNLSGTNTGDQSVDSLTNVVITAVSDGQVLTWNAGTSKWINAAGGATTITLSGDVTGTGTSSITTDVSDGLRRHFLL